MTVHPTIEQGPHATIRSGADRDGIEWGAYGVPETFVVGRDGRIAFKQVGPVTPEVLVKEILPLIRELRR